MKIGKATVPRTAICTSDEHTHRRPRPATSRNDLIGKVSFVEHFFLLLTGRLPTRRRGGGAQRDAGGDRRARPGAERAGGAHDLRRRARRDAGRGRRRHPRLRLGGARLVRDRRPDVRRDRRRGRGRRRRCDAAALDGDAGLARRRQADPRLRPSRCTRSATSASARCSRSRRDAGTDLRFVAIAEAVEALLPEVLGKAAQAQRLGARSRRCCSAPASRRRRSRACRSWRAPPA